MFSQGQIVFAAAFIIVFVIAMIVMYRKDLALHRRYYKGSLWILVAFLSFVGVLFLIKFTLKD